MRGGYMVLIALLALPLAEPAWAQGDGCDKGAGNGKGACASDGSPSAATAAKLHPGDIIKNFTVIEDPSKYGLRPYGSYYTSGGYIYLVDRHTNRVLDLVRDLV